MDKKQNNNSIKAFALLLLVAMIALMLIVGTYAKYTTELTGSDKVIVAKWAWTINGEDVTESDTNIQVDLFSTILDTADGNTETDVATKRIAPGTKGSFAIEVENKSEVNANCVIELSETKGADVENANIQYSKDGVSGWTSDISSLNVNEVLDMGTGTKTVTVYWQWVYNVSAQQDTTDTEVGFAAANSTNDEDNKTITVDAALRFTQVD